MGFGKTDLSQDPQHDLGKYLAGELAQTCNRLGINGNDFVQVYMNIGARSMAILLREAIVRELILRAEKRGEIEAQILKLQIAKRELDDIAPDVITL